MSTDMEGNSDEDRQITDRLYSGDRKHRLEQEMVLGVGGARALAALGWKIDLHHLNEGHAGFAVLELVNRVLNGDDFEAALERIRPSLMFTTHTPVPAGIDRFDGPLVGAYVDRWVEHWGLSPDTIWDLGRDPDDPHMFNMAALCLNVSAAANGVSELHGEVSRKMFAGIGIGDDITSVTNGVHARTWTGSDAQAIYDRIAGPVWEQGEPEAWEKIAAIDDQTLAELKRAGSERLAHRVAEATGQVLDPDALIVGFARRFAPYKRSTLMFRRMDLLTELLASDQRPVHFVFAGKAHPRDGDGKQLLADIVAFANSPESNGRFTFLPGYDMEKALAMFEGCDVWLNNPIRPREASGTSGEKSVLNGGLNASILDGWWAEMYDGRNGWAIPTSDREGDGRDDDEAVAVLETLADIAAEYHDRRTEFYDRVRHSMRTLGPRVTAARMLSDYQERLYGPLLSADR
jgi:starch phosphorylase